MKTSDSGKIWRFNNDIEVTKLSETLAYTNSVDDTGDEQQLE